MRAPGRHLVLAFVSGALFVGLAAAVQADRVGDFDEGIRMGVHGFASPPLTAFAEKLTWLGSVGVLVLLSAVTVAVLIIVHRRIEAVCLTATMAGALALENGLKFWFRRMRPPAFFGSEPMTYSFPSGHALLSLCFYAGLAIAITRISQSPAMRTGIWIATISLVLAIGGTRIYLGVHYPSDVVGGYLVAIAWLNVVLLVKPRFAS